MGPANLSDVPPPFRSFLDQLSINMATKGPSIFINFNEVTNPIAPKLAHLGGWQTGEHAGAFFQRHTDASLIIWDTGINLYGDCPYGMKNNCEYTNFYEYIEHLSDVGLGILPKFTSGLNTKNGNKLIHLLRSKGYDLYGYIELPSYVFDGSSNYLFAMIRKGLFEDIVRPIS